LEAAGRRVLRRLKKKKGRDGNPEAGYLNGKQRKGQRKAKDQSCWK